MFISPPLFLDSPGLAPYLVVVARKNHKIGYLGGANVGLKMGKAGVGPPASQKASPLTRNESDEGSASLPMMSSYHQIPSGRQGEIYEAGKE